MQNQFARKAPCPGSTEPKQSNDNGPGIANITEETLRNRTPKPETGAMLGKEMLEALLVSNRETGGHPVLPEGSKAEVVGSLMYVLEDEDLLQSYLENLATSARCFGLDRPRHTELLPLPRQEALFTGGPDMLDDRELAALLLNPLALSIIHETLLDWAFQGGGDVDQRWFDALAAAGKRAAQRANVRPDLDTLLGRSCT